MLYQIFNDCKPRQTPLNGIRSQKYTPIKKSYPNRRCPLAVSIPESTYCATKKIELLNTNLVEVLL